MKEDYRPPYHLGEGNPDDWIGRFVYDIALKECKYYAIFKRSKSIGNYGKITEEIKYFKDSVKDIYVLKKDLQLMEQ